MRFCRTYTSLQQVRVDGLMLANGLQFHISHYHALRLFQYYFTQFRRAILLLHIIIFAEYNKVTHDLIMETCAILTDSVIKQGYCQVPVPSTILSRG